MREYRRHMVGEFATDTEARAAVLATLRGRMAKRRMAAARRRGERSDGYTAADAVARHCASMGLPLRQIIDVLAYLAAEVPCWPDADEIAAIATAAVVVEQAQTRQRRDRCPAE